VIVRRRLRERALSTRWLLRQRDLRAVVAGLLSLVLVAYLGIRGGGYDPVLNSQVGIVGWWILLLIALFASATSGITKTGRLMLGLLVAYSAWTAASLAWTQSSERTMGDVSLQLVYVALALLVFLVLARTSARHALNGLAVAIGVVGLLALASRLHFQWFSPPGTNVLAGSTRRLSYPVNYWNALAYLMAMGIPLAVWAACTARQLITRGVAAGSVPLLALCVFLTVSRGGTVAVAIGAVVLVVLARNRLALIGVIAVCGAGSAVVILAANQRPAVRDGLRTSTAATQGNELAVIALGVAVAVGLVVVALALLGRRVPPRVRFDISRRRATGMSAVALLLALAVFAAAGGPGFLSREWTQFKAPAAPAAVGTNAFQRLQSVTGEGRYQYWEAAVSAARAKPLTGTGAGTFEFWWARHGNATGGFVRDTHSLYLQALAELGWPGLILITAFVLVILLSGVLRAIRTAATEERQIVAAATAAAAVFAFGAALEWIWLIPVLPVAFFVVAAAIATPAPPGRVAPTATVERSRTRWRTCVPLVRIVGALLCLGASIVIAVPMVATQAVRDSQALARAGHFRLALAKASDATVMEPYAGSPWLQRALVLESSGEIGQALAAAQHATREGPTDYTLWLVASRLEARNGDARAALQDYLKARVLSPRAAIFQN
jgi:O-antigen ligase